MISKTKRAGGACIGGGWGDTGMDETTGGSDRLLAALAAGAGGIHMAMVPSHMNEWALEGVSFAIVAWLQILAAVAILLRPSTRLKNLLAAGSALLIVLWAMSRTTGFPIGPHSGGAENAAFVDLVCVGLEFGVLVVVCGLRTMSVRAGAFARVLPVGVLALSTVAVASPSARNHAHGEHGHGSEAAHGHTTDPKAAVASLAAGHTHADDFKPYAPMDVATFKLLGEQLTQVRAVTLRFPTVADALAAGFVRYGSFVPGQGAHYGPPPGLPSSGDTPIDHPSAWLYAGTEPTSPVVGLMYAGNVDFAGPNDRFHSHTDVCVATPIADGSVPVLSESEGITSADCRAKGGSYSVEVGPLIHVWAVPGWESPIGVFSHDNPLVACTDGQKPSEVTHGKGGCKGLA